MKYTMYSAYRTQQKVSAIILICDTVESNKTHAKGRCQRVIRTSHVQKKKRNVLTYNVILLRVRLTTVAMEKQQCVFFVAVIYTVMSLTIMWGTVRSLCIVPI